MFLKKGTSRTGFSCVFSCLLGSWTADAHWGVVRQQPRVLQAQVEQCHSLALVQNREGRARRVRRSPDSAHHQTKAWKQDKSGIHRGSPASKWGQHGTGQGADTSGDGSSQKQDSRACLRQSYLQQGSQGESHKYSKTDATVSNTGHCFKWAVLAFLMALPAICYPLPS